MKRLLQHNTLFFGMLYFFLIPVFGTIYYFLPEGYIHYGELGKSYISSIYFSTVTIVTLGFGDIFPTNSITALLVSIESISGVMMIGFFLNAVSLRKSEDISEKERRRQERLRYENEVDKLLRYEKIIMLEMNAYLKYTAIITTPPEKRKGSSWADYLNPDFSFNDMYTLFQPASLLAGDYNKTGAAYYFKHQRKLEYSIKEFLLYVDLCYWKDLEKLCINFIDHCNNHDSSEFLLTIEPDSEEAIRLSEDIRKYSGKIEYSGPNEINPFITLYHSIKYNLEFIDNYNEMIESIRNTVEY